MVAAEGPCHLTDWVEGKTPDAADEGVLESAGALQGAMHGATLTPSVRNSGFPFGKWASRNRRNVRELEAAGALDETEAKTLLDAHANEAPPSASGVIIHADLAPENLIVAVDGKLILVDEENFSVDAPGFDLARTWYRWPLNEARWRPFLLGYERYADPTPYLEYSRYWNLVVLTEAAHFRVLRNTPGASVPLDRLRKEMGKRSRNREGQ